MADQQQLFDEIDRRTLAEVALRHITDTTSRARGEDFFRVLVRDMAAALEVFYVIAGRLVHDEQGQECNQTLAVWAGEDYLPNMRYSLEHTPCSNVADQSMCFHPCNICEEYPLDTLLQDMQAESYIGMPMIDTQGKTLGILVALDKRPIDENKRLLGLSLLSIFAARCAAELQHQDREEALERIVEERTQVLRQAQSKLIEQEKMAALGALVAGVAHEVNTPIGVAVTAASGLREFAAALQEKLAGGAVKRSELQDLVSHLQLGAGLVEDNLHRAANLIGNFKQLAVDQSNLQISDFDLADYIASIFTAHGPELKKAGVAYSLELPAAIRVHLPAGKIAQLLSNLIMNSLIHGFADCARGTISVSGQLQGNQVHLRFADDGRGAPAEVRARMFEPFFTTRRGQGGSGLGMHIAYNIVTSLGGEIGLADSERGLTISIRLPLRLET
ncbi:MAG TPA: ATP-binding protein [Pseudomonas sp.]|nr:ATP-binding protein [Pseudomonas sp.]